MFLNKIQLVTLQKHNRFWAFFQYFARLPGAGGAPIIMAYRNGAADAIRRVRVAFLTARRKIKMARVYNFSAGPSMLPEAV